MKIIPQPNGGYIVNAEKGETANPNGRPLKIYTILKKSGYGMQDIREAYNEISWTDEKELKRLFDDEKTPVILKVIAHAYKRASAKGDYRYVKEIIEQVIGKPKETLDARIAIVKFDVKFNE